ncbi:hypothetical protein TomTYG75_15460 [Sphingobium sp. TomTYG75]
MAEQFRLDQRFRKRGAVHDDERLAPARGEAMEAFGDQFLARATLANNQDRAIEFGGASCLLDCVKERQRLADELAVSFHDHIMVKITTYWQD